MTTYFKWLTRLLVVLTLLCAGAAIIMYFSLSTDGIDGGGGTALLYAALLGTVGFGITAAATYAIGRMLT